MHDGFSFITLTDIPANEIIFFTEQGWDDNSNTWITTTEPHLQYTAPAGGLSCGTIISIIETGSTSSDILTVTGGGTIIFAVSSNFNLSAGDQILVYQAATAKPASPANITFITGLNGDTSSDADGWNSNIQFGGGTGESALPPGLTNGTNAVGLFPFGGITEQDNAKYTGTLNGTSAALRTAINNRNNWTFMLVVHLALV